jgi:Ca2+-binding RTX toxin-like protein
MGSSGTGRKTLVVLIGGLFAVGLGSSVATAAEEHVIVEIGGTDDGGTTRDVLRVWGTTAPDVIRITEGISCGERLCTMKIEADREIQVRGACNNERATSLGPITNRKVAYCSYFGLESGHRAAEIKLNDGSDELFVTQTSRGLLHTDALSWTWLVAYEEGNDVIEAGHFRIPGEDYGTQQVISGGEGNDRFSGTWPKRRFELWGDLRNGALATHGGNDTFNQIAGGSSLAIYGGEGNDALTTALAALPGLTFDGGSGNDTATVQTMPGSVKTLIGGPGDDVLTGSSGRERLLGGAGNDRLTPQDGSDPEIDGGEGNDTIDLGSHPDTEVETVQGGAGVDTVVYGASPVRVFLDGSLASTGGDTLLGFENATGSTGADRIVGTDGANTIRSGGGVGDIIEGRGGDDTIFVVDATAGTGGADDIVDAGTGEDSVYSNDSRQDTIRCGTSSHLQSTTLNGKTISIQTPDIDRSWSDDADAVTECERRL